MLIVFTARPTTIRSETTYDWFCPYSDSLGVHSREEPVLKSNQAVSLNTKYWSERLWVATVYRLVRSQHLFLATILPDKSYKGRNQFYVVSDAFVVGHVGKLIINVSGVKHLNFVDDGRNKYWLKLIKKISYINFTIKVCNPGVCSVL